MRPPPLEGPALRVLTWNVASLRSLLKNVRAPHADLLHPPSLGMSVCRLFIPTIFPLCLLGAQTLQGKSYSAILERTTLCLRDLERLCLRLFLEAGLCSCYAVLASLDLPHPEQPHSENKGAAGAAEYMVFSAPGAH